MLLRLSLAASLVAAGVSVPPAAAAAPAALAPFGLALMTASDVGDASVTELRVLPAPAARLAVSPDAAPAPDSTDLAVVARTQVAGGFQTVALTWPEGVDPEGLGAQVRARSVDGQWSDWAPLDVADDAPDAGTSEAARSRGGTDAMWVGQSDAVELALDVQAAQQVPDLRLVTVASDEVPAVSGGRGASVSLGRAHGSDARPTSLGAVAGLAVPTVIPRSAWGAAPQVCTPDVAATLVGAVVHHTAGSNAYSTVAEAMQQIRNDQAYHIGTRGWCDLGYNFVVDKWGNIYEGRANSLALPVIGVHAGGFNTGTVGVSMLGDYTSIAPSAATLESVSQIIGYRLGAYGRNPVGQMVYTTLGGENSRYAAGTTLTLPVVIGHRDVAYTACPGTMGYPTLGAIRDRAQRIAFSEPMVQALYHDMLQRTVDPQGLGTWSAQLLAGVPPASLGDSIAHSVEYVQRRVADAYQQILGRGPDATGMATWTGLITSGRLRVEDLRGTLIQSQEYYLLAGGSDAAYVQRLYRDILGRDPGPNEIAFWMARIPAAGRGAVPHGIWRSLESAQLRVHEAFHTFLDRPADPNGLATWAPYWQANGEDALRAMVVGSEEYLARSVRISR